MRAHAANLTRMVVLTCAYLAGAKLAVWLIKDPSDVSMIWPPAGIGFAALLYYGLRWWPFIGLAVLLLHLFLAPAPPVFLPYSIAANIVGTVLGVIATRYVIGSRTIKLRIRSGLGLLLGGLLLVVSSALIGTSGMLHAGMIKASAMLEAIARWSLGDLFGIVAVTPAALIIIHGIERGRFTGSKLGFPNWPEKLIWSSLLLGSLAGILWLGSMKPAYALGLATLPLSLLMWSALRFEPILTALATLGIAVFVAFAAGLGAAGLEPPDNLLDAVILLGFMCVTALIPQLLAAANYENRLATVLLIERATTDRLTGMPNRAAFEEAMRAALKSERQQRVALAYLDLDQFKIVNDAQSHAAGDRMLVEIAAVLSSRLHLGDVLARIGGDEFGVLMRDCEPEQALARANELRSAIADYRFGVEGMIVAPTCSIGLVMLDSGADFDAALAKADAACFTAKQLGGNRIQVSLADDDAVAEQRAAMHWVMRLNEAMDSERFELACQSIVPVHPHPDGGRHFEILLRLRDANGLQMPPGYFVPAAERFGLGVRLDRHVIERTLDWLERHPRAVAQTRMCSINISAAAVVDDEFVEFLRERLARCQISPQQLCFEITETSAVHDIARAQRFIREVRRLGCKLALDDFGTGFCSFAYLRELDVDYFKIDGRFVREVDTDPLSVHIVQAIANIAKVLGKQTVAECAETVSVQRRLRSLGVDHIQGFGIDEPTPIDRYFSGPEPSLEQLEGAQPA